MTAPRMTAVARARVTKELGKAQAALWTAFQTATYENDLVLAKSLREQHKALGTAIATLNGGPVVALKELFR